MSKVIVELQFVLPNKAPNTRLEAVKRRVETMGGQVIGSTMYELVDGEVKHGLETKAPQEPRRRYNLIGGVSENFHPEDH